MHLCLHFNELYYTTWTRRGASLVERRLVLVENYTRQEDPRDRTWRSSRSEPRQKVDVSEVQAPATLSLVPTGQEAG
jgi:hypothetical protein